MAFLRSAVILCVALLHLTHAYSDGAPASTCDTLIPGHGGTAQNKLSAPIASPFTITVLGNTVVENNAPVSVNLGGSSSRYFKGFVLVAEYVDSNNVRYRAGDWSLTDSLVKSACDDGTGLTHKDSTAKSTVQVQYLAPPAPFIGNVSFWGSFVENYNAYWIELSGQTYITVIPATTPTTAPQFPAQSSPTSAVSNSEQPTQEAPAAAPGEPQASPINTMINSTTDVTKHEGTTDKRSAGPNHANHPQLKGRRTGASSSVENGCPTMQASLIGCMALWILQHL